MKRTARILPALAAAFALCLGLFGCQAPDTRAEIGFKTEEAQDIIVANGLGQDIVSLGYGNFEEGWSVEFDLQEEGNAPLAADEECVVYMETEGQPVDIIATGADGTVYEAYGVSVESGMSVKLVSDGDIAYVEYADANGNTVDTKDASLAHKAALEKEEADITASEAVLDLALALPTGEDLTLDSEAAIVAAREAYESLTDEQKQLAGAQNALVMIDAAEQGLQALKDAEAQRIAEEEAAAAAAAEAAAAEEEYYYTEDYSTDYSYSAPTQSEDSCLDEPVYRN